jgi:nucleotide-binding universal stress UspA family protein
MYKKILIAIDGSPESMEAFKNAITLGKILQASLDLLYVIPPRIYTTHTGQDVITTRSEGEPYHISLLQMEENELFDAIQSIAAKEGCEVSIHTRVGDAVEEIVRFARDHGTDLVVVGSSGKGMAGRLILGSVSTGVVHQCSCAVLVAKSDEK